MRVVIVGAGVIGMSSAIMLQKEGFDVIVVAKEFGTSLPSGNAGGIWVPYKASPVDKVSTWSKRTLEVWEEEAKNTPHWIQMTRYTVQGPSPVESQNWWADMAKRVPNKLVAGHTHGETFMVPIVSTGPYLLHLYQLFIERGGVFKRESISDLETTRIKYNGDCIVNCTGIGSRELLNDNNISGLGGTIIYLEPLIKLDGAFDYFETEDQVRDKHVLVHNYVLPRQDTIIVGGTSEAENAPHDPDLATHLLNEASRVYDERLKDLPIQRIWRGVRPCRTEIRLEVEGKIIHNYGHGGSGWTVCWGCAEDTVKLVNNLLKKSKL